ncbi:MAG: hypothetical protein II674_03055 [Prevotella sp.]|nr:hypothetical protein [Prevotella sp.]
MVVGGHVALLFRAPVLGLSSQRYFCIPVPIEQCAVEGRWVIVFGAAGEGCNNVAAQYAAE